jgi:hypothetical protein
MMNICICSLLPSTLVSAMPDLMMRHGSSGISLQALLSLDAIVLFSYIHNQLN